MPSPTSRSIAPGTDKLGTVEAIDVETGRTVWKHEQRAGTCRWWLPAGDLFSAATRPEFRAFDQSNGKVLWEVNLGSPVTGYPITYAVAENSMSR